MILYYIQIGVWSNPLKVKIREIDFKREFKEIEDVEGERMSL